MPQHSDITTHKPASQGHPASHNHPASRPPAVRALTGVFNHLVQQHRHASDLLQRAKASSWAARRGELWSQARRQLLSHERAEVLEVYSALEGYDAGPAIAEQHTRQSNEMESIINELDAIDTASKDWAPKLLDVIALFEEHVEEEERDFFPRAQGILGESMALELEERYESAQRAILDTLP
jgi:hypothetical protein